MAVSNESLLARWYHALWAADCVQLERLLEAHPYLVMEGWKESQNWTCKGTLQVGGTGNCPEEKWKGYTALHAAARRGCLELVTAIVDMFSFNYEGEWLLEDPGNRSCFSADAVASTLADLLAERDGWHKLEPFAIAAVYGDRGVMEALMVASLKCKRNPYQIERKRSSITREECDTGAELRRITEEVLASLTVNERSTIEAQYSMDATYNRLPLEEYLLPYTFSSTDVDPELSNKVQKKILDAVNSGAESVGSRDLKNFVYRRLWYLFKSERPRVDEVSVDFEEEAATESTDGGHSRADEVVSLVVEKEIGTASREVVQRRAEDEMSPSVLLVFGKEDGAMTREAEHPSVEEVSPSVPLIFGKDGTVTREAEYPRFDELSPSVSLIIEEEIETQSRQVSSSEDMRGLLRKVTKERMASLSVEKRIEERMTIYFEYFEDPDFNFLAIEEYLFAFTFTSNVRIRDKRILNLAREGLWRKIDGNPRSRELKRFLMLELRDGRGRTALHVAAESGREDVEAFLSLLPEGDEYADWLNSRDGAGRTPLYMAAARGDTDVLLALMEDARVDLNAEFVVEFYANSCERGPWAGSLSTRNGFQDLSLPPPLTPLQIAILLRKPMCVRLLLEDENKERPDGYQLNLNCAHYCNKYILKPLALAVWVGDATIVELLLKEPRVCDPGGMVESPEYAFPALHFAAALGKFDLVKVFLDMKGIDELYNPFVRDAAGNTAMHHVTQGKDDPFMYHLLHLVDPDEAPLYRKATDHTNDPEQVKKRFIERQGCVGLLLHAGLDVSTLNYEDQAPYPKQTSPEFLSWWYDKLGKETLEEQNTLNAAANAISVTAALVATASFVGPLQPPLSYESNGEGVPSQIQVHNVWVRVFIACDTLSFYLAVGAIMLAVIPSLPIQQQRVRMEIKHTRRIVTFAVGFLFPSVISILLALAASTMAVIPNYHGGLQISTSVVGGSLCVLVICIFSVRVLGLVMHKNRRIKKLYGDYIFLDEIVARKWKESGAGKILKLVFREPKRCTRKN